LSTDPAASVPDHDPSESGPLRLRGADAILAREGQLLGVGPWHRIDAETVRAFADATGDHQPIHLDPDAARVSGLPGPIAHGYLTLALEPQLVADVVVFEGFRHAFNYGLDRVRFPASVPVGAFVRAHVVLASAERRGTDLQIVLDVTVEVRDGERPACVARPVRRLVE